MTGSAWYDFFLIFISGILTLCYYELAMLRVEVRRKG